MAPALIGEKLNYDSLEVSSGMDLQIYADLLLTGMADDEHKDQMIQSLLADFRQDTLAMVELVKWLMAQT